MKGLEPPRPKTLDPKSNAATNYATCANCMAKVSISSDIPKFFFAIDKSVLKSNAIQMPSSAITNAIDNAITKAFTSAITMCYPNAITSAIAIDTLCNGLYGYGAICEGSGEGAGGGGAGLEDGRYGTVGDGASYGLEVGVYFGGVV